MAGKQADSGSAVVHVASDGYVCIDVHVLAAAAEQCDLSAVRVHPRFSVEQGVREDGTKKIRAVDNFSWANAPGGPKKRKLESVNGHTSIPEKLKHDHIDDLLAAVKLFLRWAALLWGAFALHASM